MLEMLATAVTDILVCAGDRELPAEIARAAGRRDLRPFPLPPPSTLVLSDDHNPLDLWSPALNLSWRQSMVAWLGEETLTD